MLVNFFSRDLKKVRSMTYVVADIEGLGHPVVGDASKSGRQAVNVFGRGAAVGVNVAIKAPAVHWVTDEEDALDGVERGASQLGKGVGRGGRSL